MKKAIKKKVNLTQLEKKELKNLKGGDGLPGGKICLGGVSNPDAFFK